MTEWGAIGDLQIRIRALELIVEILLARAKEKGPKTEVKEPRVYDFNNYEVGS